MTNEFAAVLNRAVAERYAQSGVPITITATHLGKAREAIAAGHKRLDNCLVIQALREQFPAVTNCGFNQADNVDAAGKSTTLVFDRNLRELIINFDHDTNIEDSNDRVLARLPLTFTVTEGHTL